MTETDENLVENRGTESIFKEFYPVAPPFGYVGIKVDDLSGKRLYNVIEPTMTEEEADILRSIKEAIILNVGVPLNVLKDEVLMREYLDTMIRKT